MVGFSFFNLEQFARDVVLYIFKYHSHDDSYVKKVCSCPKSFLDLGYRPNYLFSKWGQLMIKQELDISWPLINAQIHCLVTELSIDKPLDRLSYFESNRIFKYVEDRLFEELNKSDVYGSLYIKCIYLVELAITLYKKNLKSAPNYAIRYIKPLAEQAWHDGVIDGYEDTLRGMTIRLFEQMFACHKRAVPSMGIIDVYKKETDPVSENLPNVWENIKEDMNDFLTSFKDELIAKCGSSMQTFEAEHLEKVSSELLDEVTDVEKRKKLVALYPITYSDERKVVYKAFARIALLMFHYHSSGKSIYRASEQPISKVTNAFIKCLRQGMVAGPSYITDSRPDPLVP